MTERLTLHSLQREVDRVTADQVNHEKECGLRYQQLNGNIADLKDGMKWVIRLAAGLLISVTSWTLVTLYNHNSDALARVNGPPPYERAP